MARKASNDVTTVSETDRSWAATLLLLIPLTACAPDGGWAQTPDFYPTEAGPDHLLAVPGWDVGTGFLRIRPSPDGPPGAAPADTVAIRSGPRPDATPVGRAFHRDYRSMVEATEEDLRDGALEVGYEERVLPVVGTTPDGRWLHVSFAFDAEGEPRTGWVDGDDPLLDHHGWEAWLGARGSLFFIEPDSIAFFTARDGDRSQLPLEPGTGTLGYDYILYPVSADGAERAGRERTEDGGPWMEVRVVSPSDYCAARDTGTELPVDTRAWIRALTDGGRPRVWYFTRGC